MILNYDELQLHLSNKLVKIDKPKNNLGLRMLNPGDTLISNCIKNTLKQKQVFDIRTMEIQ